MQVRRGDVVIVELDPTKESEQRGMRPYLVVQSDVGNENAPTTIVAHFMMSFGVKLYPFEVFADADESLLRENSVMICSQLRTISIRHRIRENVGSVPDNWMGAVDTAL